MTIIELLLVGIGLGMDACSIAVCKGLCMKVMNWNKAFIIALYFATFQLIMPLIGYYLGNNIGDHIKKYGHIIAFILLVLLGINMLKEALSKDDYHLDDDVSFKKMLMPSIATSIDALTVGTTFSLLDVNILNAVIIIFIVTFILSFLGTKVGQLFKERYRSKASIVGGVILIIMGIKMLI